MDNTVQGKKAGFAPIREDASRIIVSYGMIPVGETVDATWREVYLYKKKTPQVTTEIVKQAILADINKRTDKRIITGFTWEGKPVWLSTENQFNYKAAYDLAAQTEGANLPLKFKLGEDEDGQPVYHTFRSLNSLYDFYTQAIGYIQQCLQDGWNEKDNIDWSQYAIGDSDGDNQ